MRKLVLGLLAATLSCAPPLCAPLAAQELRIGSTYPPSVDPHFVYLLPNIGYNRHLYEPLVAQAPDRTLVPGLATSWEAVSPTRWRFHLRTGVTFHGGAPFTADDVVFSYGRVTSVANNPGPYTPFLVSVVAVEKVDDHTVDIVTDHPNPLIPDQANGILIVSAKAAAGRTTQDFTSGLAAVGTGPYRYAGLRLNESLRLERFDGYWGPRPAWATVSFRVITAAPSRIAALRSGDVDLIDLVPPSDANDLAKDTRFRLSRAATNRILFIGTNQKPATPVSVTDAADVPLSRNPFADARVRRAVSLALNRAGIADRIFGGHAEPAAQLAVPGVVGFLPDRRPDVQSVEAARRLLDTAGYPTGFKTGFWCPDLDVYPQLCQAVGQMLARIGIRTDVTLMPPSMYFSRVKPPENPAPLYVTGWNNLYNDALNALLPIGHSYDTAKRLGSTNAMGYRDAGVDALLEDAAREMDPARHRRLVEDAMRKVVEDDAVIPVARVDTLFASRAGIAYRPGVLNLTLATQAFPGQE